MSSIRNPEKWKSGAPPGLRLFCQKKADDFVECRDKVLRAAVRMTLSSAGTKSWLSTMSSIRPPGRSHLRPSVRTAWTLSFLSKKGGGLCPGGVVDWTSASPLLRFSTFPLLHFSASRTDGRMGSPAATRTSFASIPPSVREAVKWRSGKVEKRKSGLDKVPAGAKAVRLCRSKGG
jgi:hypothetical protein